MSLNELLVGTPTSKPWCKIVANSVTCNSIDVPGGVPLPSLTPYQTVVSDAKGILTSKPPKFLVPAENNSLFEYQDGFAIDSNVISTNILKTQSNVEQTVVNNLDIKGNVFSVSALNAEDLFIGKTIEYDYSYTDTQRWIGVSGVTTVAEWKITCIRGSSNEFSTGFINVGLSGISTDSKTGFSDQRSFILPVFNGSATTPTETSVIIGGDSKTAPTPDIFVSNNPGLNKCEFTFRYINPVSVSNSSGTAYINLVTCRGFSAVARWTIEQIVPP